MRRDELWAMSQCVLPGPLRSRCQDNGKTGKDPTGSPHRRGEGGIADLSPSEGEKVRGGLL